MDYLMRGDIDFTEQEWEAIDHKVVETAKIVLTGRKFIDIYGPLGAGIEMLKTYDITGSNPVISEIPMLSADFTLTWRELEAARRTGIPLSLSQVAAAAYQCALQEDKMIFLGDKEAGIKGLTTETGVKKVKITGWNEGENAFTAVAEGLQYMLENDTYGDKVLAVSPDVYAGLQRIQPGTGTLESERIGKLLEGGIYRTPVLPAQTAVLVATGSHNLDLAIGQDMITGYLGSSELNYDFRVFETVLLRIKNKKAIIVYGK